MNEIKPDWKNRFQEAFTPYSTDEVICEAITEKNRNIPEKLFRFRTFNKKHKNFTEDEMCGKLCFQPRSKLNDPYDGTIMQKYNDPLTYFKEHHFIRREVLDNALSCVYTKEVCDKLIEHMLSQYNSVSPDIPNITHSDYQTLLSNTIEKVNGFISRSNIRFKNRLDRYSQIVCFSEKLTNMPMWAHYSSNHEGYCFEYRFKQLDYNDQFSKIKLDYLMPVSYLDKLYDYIDVILSTADITNSFDIYPCSEKYFFRTFVTNKLRDWSYEREWRMIMGIGELAALKGTVVDYTNHPVFEQPALVKLMSKPQSIPILKPSAIYLGVKVKPDVRDFLISKAVQNNISVYQMELTLTGLQASLIHDCNHE